MSNKIRFPFLALSVDTRGLLLPLFALLHSGNVWADCNINRDIDIQCPGHTQTAAIYDNSGGTPITDQIALCPAPASSTKKVDWTFSAAGAGTCTSDTNGVTCTDSKGNMVLTPPAPPGLAPANFSGKVPSGFGIFTITVTDNDNPGTNCSRTYNFNTLGTSGGWGDPHITTFDGVHYDFQGAGEFAVLRGKGMEIQARQTPVATTTLPGTSAYSGLATCVSTYSAIATRVGTHRISYEPNISGVPDPTGLQLRVDGVLTPLGPEGINLRPASANQPGGRIVQTWTGGGIEIQYPDGTQLVVVPAYWADQQKWYLNVNVYGTTASEGIFGKLAKDSWLPALPDGTSLGPQPDALHQRYVDLYQKFADAWRVTDATSLFDYGPGTTTATFSVADWPRESPRSCDIPGQVSAEPVAVTVAETACAAITDSNMKHDCVYDVSVTGHTGFAQTYLVTQKLKPPPGWAGTSTAGGGTGTGTGTGHVDIPRWLIFLLLIILILLAIWWFRRK